MHLRLLTTEGIEYITLRLKVQRLAIQLSVSAKKNEFLTNRGVKARLVCFIAIFTKKAQSSLKSALYLIASKVGDLKVSTKERKLEILLIVSCTVY